MRKAPLSLCLLLTASAAAAAPAAPKRVVLPGGVVPLHYDLSIVPDAKAKTFTGTLKATVQVLTPTRRIELNAADLTFSRFAFSGSAEEPTVYIDKEKQTVLLGFKTPVAPGRYSLAIDYAGKVNDNAAGLFALDYKEKGEDRRDLFTQFENSDARRFMPCWDEPALKATFSLSAVVPDGLMAVSNMPMASRERLPDGRVRVSFQETPRMSTYLLFFALGDFERLSRSVDGVDVGVVVKRGDADKARYALDAAAHILPYYEDYFGVPYPLPKLDLIAGPGGSQFFSAMENWGAIFFFERAMLIDPALSTEGDRRRVYTDVAHEMAHQWFGDLVTMQWWDDLWLNEGFASWMEDKASGRFNPEWKLGLQQVDVQEWAMHTDAKAGTHPVIQPIYDVLQANEAFDSITYSKGESVIRMLERYVGEDVFRDGVRAYIKAHAYGNTVTDDLWAALDKAAGRPVSQVAHDFTLQAGVPLIRAERTAGGLRLSQGRFAVDATGKAPTVWRVPVVVETADGKPLWKGLVSRGKPVVVPVPAGAVAVVNAGKGSYFRTLYDPALEAALAARFAELTPADQLGLLDDASALGYAGQEPLTDLLSLVEEAKPGMEPRVLSDVVGQVSWLADLYRGRDGETAVKAWGRKVLGPVMASVGWEARPGEDPNAAILRRAVIDVLSFLDDPDVVAEGRRRFEGFAKDPKSLTGDLRSDVLAVAAAHADAATWERLHEMALSAASSMERREFYSLLGAAHDRGLAQRALDLALTDEAPVTVRPSIIGEVAGYFPELAFDFTAKHLKAVDDCLEPDSRNEFPPRLASGSKEASTAQALRAFADKHIPPTARQSVTKAEASIAYAVMIRRERLPAVDRWLAAKASSAR
ncbi:MAG: M1 family metallopeptidase [Elusimicrobia bacterium]|nr:M1 family metallopeptidase [Elusimicrobiota bacterium]